MLLPPGEVVQWIFLYKYYILFPVMVVEGPVVTIIAGMFISSGHLDGLVSYMILVAGDLAGDSLYYAIGHRAGKKIILKKWGLIFGLTKQRIGKFETFFHSHKAKTLLIGKWSHAMGVPVLVAAGLARVPYGEFLGISCLATLPKTLVLLLVGYYFGKSYEKIATYLGYTASVTVAVVLLLVFYIVIKIIYQKVFNRN